jgi:phospholipid transport system substrate-binding protein
MKNLAVRSFFFFLILLISTFYSTKAFGVEESPMEKIKQATEEITAILNDFCKDPEGKRTETVDKIMAIADRHFDWEEMAKRTLARFWKKRTPEEKKEFVQLFRDLLKNAYIGKIESYSGENVIFEGERTENNYAIVKTKVISPTKSVEVPVNYRLRKKGNDWLVYDIVIEGVSLVNNYRVQFNHIIQSSSYEALVKKIKDKLAEES